MIDRRWGALFWFEDEATAREGRIYDTDQREVLEGALLNGKVLPISLETIGLSARQLQDSENLAYKAGVAAALAQVRAIRDVGRGYGGVLDAIEKDLTDSASDRSASEARL